MKVLKWLMAVGASGSIAAVLFGAVLLVLDVLVAGGVGRDRRGAIGVGVARLLGAVHGHGAPDVAPGGETDAERPPCGARHPASKRQAARHP